MRKKISLDEAARLITRSLKPVFFLDTCVLLDVFRVVERTESFNPFKLYLQLAEKVKKDEVLVFINETIENELRYNTPIVVKEQRSKIQNLNRRWNAFRSLKDRKEVINEVNLSSDKIIRSAELTVHTILRNAYVIKNYDMALRLSYEAVLSHKAPAARSSQFKDAYIFRTCLDLAKKSERSVIFCSTNTTDYCEDTRSKRVHPEIKSQAEVNNVLVALSLGDAYKLLIERNI